MLLMRFGVMMTPNRGDILQREIIWTGVDYSDLSGFKVRPVLVISNNKYNKTHPDVICCAMTSSYLYLDCCVDINIDDYVEVKNKNVKNSRVRCDWILRVDKGLVDNRYGKITQEKLNEVLRLIQNLLETDD